MMWDAIDGNAIPEAAREVVELYRTRAETLRFPDMDLDVLVARADAVGQAGRRVSELQAQLELERAAAREAEAALMTASRRAVAYAKVFAENDAELLEALKGLALSKPADPVKPGRGGRRRKKATSARAERPDTLNLVDASPDAHGGAETRSEAEAGPGAHSEAESDSGNAAPELPIELPMTQ